jgi:predicted metal-dependent hydrolase
MELNYIIQKSWRRSISVSVLPDNRILVKAPYMATEHSIKDFISTKKDWIKKQIQKQIGEKEQAELLGLLSSDDVKKIKKRAKEIFLDRVNYWAKKIGVTYGRISIRLQTSRWGSCSQNGNLSFNCLLAIMPSEVMDSVIVHELCHRKYMNHSKKFYKEIDKVFPDYKKYNNWLKENGSIYMKRVDK